MNCHEMCLHRVNKSLKSSSSKYSHQRLLAFSLSNIKRKGETTVKNVSMIEAGQTLHRHHKRIVRRLDLERLPFTGDRGWMNLQRKRSSQPLFIEMEIALQNQATCRFLCFPRKRISDQSIVLQKRVPRRARLQASFM